ncbi:MAG: P-II family nitrogen regulator [Treponema sp.]|nr:P-II family nitrogen regulator [Treponema sp.]
MAAVIQDPLRLFFVIIDWDKSEAVSKVFAQAHIRFHFVRKGMGTAPSDILNTLGIGESEKAVVLCIERKTTVPTLIKGVHKILGRRSFGAGIAFTVPLSSINNPALLIFNQSLRNFKLFPIRGTEKMEKDKKPISNDLIIAIINQGHSDAFMTTAREAGARGGTVMNARGLANRGSVKVFGASVQEEREIILIVTRREQKNIIMQAVSKNFGITTPAGGIIFSCPVDSIVSLNQESE